MTDKELYKEAEEWAKDHHYYNGTINGYVAERDAVINAYIDSAKPREKYITELEKEREVIKNVMYEFLNCMEEHYYPTEESLKIAKEFAYGKE